jgi:hypothetical protein
MISIPSNPVSASIANAWSIGREKSEIVEQTTAGGSFVTRRC